MKTIIGIVLDESSSMTDRKLEVLNGFNQFLVDQKEITDDTARLFLVKFHSKISVVLKGVPLNDVKPMTAIDYQPQGCTALYDAIRQCVKIMDEEKTSEERAICVIMTDGQENSSKETTMDDIRHMIQTHEQQNDWTFIYIGVEIEEWIRSSGMRSTHCSAGFSRHLDLQYDPYGIGVLPHSGPPPPYQSPRSTSSRIASRFARINCFASSVDSLNLSDGMSEGVSKEMGAMNEAVSCIRSSRDKTSETPFSSKSDH